MEKIVHVNTTLLFGFDKDEEGQLRVNPEQGAVVRRIFREYLRGFGEGEIARRLRGYGKAGREPFWRCAAACRKHRGTRTRTTFPEQEVRRVMVGTEHTTDF